MFEISKIGKEMLRQQRILAERYHYSIQPEKVKEESFEDYKKTIPEDFRNNITTNRKGYEVSPVNMPLYSKDGTLIAEKYDRIVIGQYGAFIEIDNNDVKRDNFKVKAGQEYRISNPYYASKVKYQWFTCKDNSDCKLYYQQKGVIYADYLPDKWYISPFEVCEKQELEALKILNNNKEETIDNDEIEIGG